MSCQIGSDQTRPDQTRPGICDDAMSSSVHVFAKYIDLRLFIIFTPIFYSNFSEFGKRRKYYIYSVHSEFCKACE
ncbi:hypothetical protein POVCU2_0053210 [Plasmodium ovale curtisi]|uniref:Uncharacterized protein n=1 Tax=Plasmodium ovale curtisi TaxID=864141 RepID=A0A1A8W883_PLAOA|nr:hypothetical protein POVCU2_0053210 [Plasmodium ovale curtisi]